MENLSHTMLSQYNSGGDNMDDGDDQVLLSGLSQQSVAWCELLPVEAANEASKEPGNDEGTVQLQEKKKGAKGTAGSRGSKRRRSPSGPIETANGGSNEGGGSETVSDQLVAPATGMEPGGGRRRLTKDRRTGWWEDTVNSPGYTDADFLRDFLMLRRTFKSLCEEKLADAVVKNDTAIPLEKRVAVCVWRLATGESFRRMSDRFKLGLATCQRFFHDGCAAIKAALFPKVVLWPAAADMAASAAKFQAMSGIPGIVGAVYTTHLAINAPKKHAMNYFNPRATARNKNRCSYSVTLQASVNADGTFNHVCAGDTGAKSDHETLLGSSLTKPDRAGEILAQGMFLVGGASYPLLDWMLVPYSGQDLTVAQRRFNERVAKMRDVAVNGCRRLKARWGCLQKRSELEIKDIPTVLEACCALHNFCELSGDPFDPELLQGLDLHDDHHMVADGTVPSATAVNLRDAVLENFIHGDADL